ncbi:MAG TPA: tRNA-dihydrouridine synthase, partial [Candidatus Saccharimonadales bacterium]|nr:tRNA-dihydrouridine synthase [Candidatus Saccharimonadales bacterium]
GNGDMNSLSDVEEKYKKFGADGYMIGTGIFANPWLFNKDVNMLEKTLPERIDLYLHHIDLFEKQWGSERNFASLKKFAKTYISNIPDSASFRESLMETKSLDELKSKLKNFKD